MPGLCPIDASHTNTGPSNDRPPGLSVAQDAFGQIPSNKRNVGPYVEDGAVDSVRSLTIFNGAINNKKLRSHLLLMIVLPF
jgi:hypothetical protein